MRIVKIIFTLFIALSFSACNEDALNQLATVPSQLCGNTITGVEGLYWDIRNGFARGDIPNAPPVISNPGGTYGHPFMPLLGFQYPVGWTPTTLNNTPTQLIGVNLFRNDNAAIFRYYQESASGFVSVDDLFNFELNGMLATFGVNNPTTVCQRSGSDNSTGLVLSGRSALIRAGNMSAIINVSTTLVPGLNSTFLSVQVTAAPTAEHEGEIMNTFLPIGWQLLFRDTGTTLLDDRDGDGVPDINDNFPDDPTRQ